MIGEESRNVPPRRILKLSPLKTAGFLAIPFAVFGMIFFILDLALSQFNWFGLIPSQIRVADPVFHHGLRANQCAANPATELGPAFQICTNSLGFRDRRVREVAPVSDRRRLVVIGDSFTEGFGVSFEVSYVGVVAARHPEIELLNAGVSSYAPSAYHRKIKWLIEKGYKVDHVLVMVDVSDIQDEASIYYVGEPSGRLMVREGPITDQSMGRAHHELSPGLRKFIEENLALTRHLLRSAMELYYRFTAAGKPIDPFTWARSTWTYEPPEKLADDYRPLGVQGGIDKATAEMDALYRFLAERRIPLSVGVYPWPAQLKRDTVDSPAVKIWRNWCEGRCAHFVNTFPAFFSYAAAHPENWYQDLFLHQELHYNDRGNRLMADVVEAEMTDILGGRK